MVQDGPHTAIDIDVQHTMLSCSIQPRLPSGHAEAHVYMRSGMHLIRAAPSADSDVHTKVHATRQCATSIVMLTPFNVPH